LTQEDEPDEYTTQDQRGGAHQECGPIAGALYRTEAVNLVKVFQDPFGHLQFDMESHPIGTARIWLVGTPYDLQCLLRVELNHTATNLIG